MPGTLFQHLHDIGAGRRPLPATADGPVRHHYIAQLLLREFLDRTQRRDRLWQLDKHSGQVVPQTTAAAASVRRLYRVRDPQGCAHDHLEAFFGMVETHAAPSLVALRASPLTLSIGDRANVGLLLALQDQRTPAGQRRITDQLSAGARLSTAVRLADARWANRVYLRDNPEATYEEAEDFRVRSLRELEEGILVLEAPKEWAMHAMLKTWLTCAGALLDLSWKVLRSTRADFVLGDRPMVMHDPTPRFPFSGNGLKSSVTAYTLMPLSPHTCLRIDQLGGAMEERRVERQVASINLRAYGWAERFVYGADRDTLVALHARACSEPETVPRPRPDPQVICEEADPNDPTVGDGHPPGYPRGLHQSMPDGTTKFFAYRLQYTDDPRTVGIDRSFYRPAA